MSGDVRERLDASPMSRAQIAAVAVTVGLNALDGFDVLAISFAAPGIAQDWGIDRAAHGLVLAMELVGMALGSLLLGGVADRYGRRPVVLACLAVMALGMFGAPMANNVTELSAWRVLTGIGIGGMIPSLNALAAEYSNARWRRLALSLMVIGYPLGAVIGGSVAAILLRDGDWRAVFYFGAAATLAFVLLAVIFIPESPHYLIARQPKRALERLNRVLARLRHAAVTAMPEPSTLQKKGPASALFSKHLVATTLLVTTAYFAHILVFYFVVKWLPKIVVDMGYDPSSAAGVLVALNIGGVIGGLLFGVVAQRTGLKLITVCVMVATTISVIMFGRGSADLSGLTLIAAIAGVFMQAGIVAVYTLFAEAFPTEVRAAGTGFAISVGRGGAVLAPVAAGLLFEAGLSMQHVAILLAQGSLIAAGVVLFMRLRPPAPAR